MGQPKTSWLLERECITMPDELLDRIAAVMAEAWDEGCPVAQRAAETAPIALRRWRSGARRHVPLHSREARIQDLADGLIERFETNPRLVGALKRDYEYLAARIVDLLLETEDAV